MRVCVCARARCECASVTDAAAIPTICLDVASCEHASRPDASSHCTDVERYWKKENACFSPVLISLIAFVWFSERTTNWLPSSFVHLSDIAVVQHLCQVLSGAIRCACAVVRAFTDRCVEIEGETQKTALQRCKMLSSLFVVSVIPKKSRHSSVICMLLVTNSFIKKQIIAKNELKSDIFKGQASVIYNTIGKHLSVND